MNVTCVSVRVNAEHEDLASGLLWEAGTLGVEVRPAGETVDLHAYFEARPELLDDLRAALAPATPAVIEPLPLPQVDWLARFREGFRAFDAGGFRVVPAWETDDGGDPARRLIVDPGRAFGTGTHETTRLCLALLRDSAERAPLGRVLDLGCGSGILAVAARRLGAAYVAALDHDLEAVLSAREHARRNGVAFDVLLGDGGRALRPGRFDLLLANLMAPLLLERRDELLALVAPGGELLLSGLLVSDVDALRAAYAPLGTLDERRDGEWAALRVVRP
jgi:ribosomal protein L11 methyltransferase